MNDLDSNTKKEINKLILVSIVAFATLIFCAYKLDGYIEMAIAFIFGVVLILYATNKKVQDLLHSCKWL